MSVLERDGAHAAPPSPYDDETDGPQPQLEGQGASTDPVKDYLRLPSG